MLTFDVWRAERHGDDSVVRRCVGPTLDVGCGPGRIAHAVGMTGVPALGIDISSVAVAEARARGAAVLLRDVFGDVPGAGRWQHVLLLDGNIGIGADPAALLRRCNESLCNEGTVLVEIEPADLAVRSTTLRLVVDGTMTRPVSWARVGRDAIAGVAAGAGLDVTDRWCSGGRAFAELRRRDGFRARRLAG